MTVLRMLTVGRFKPFKVVRNYYSVDNTAMGINWPDNNISISYVKGFANTMLHYVETQFHNYFKEIVKGENQKWYIFEKKLYNLSLSTVWKTCKENSITSVAGFEYLFAWEQ